MYYFEKQFDIFTANYMLNILIIIYVFVDRTKTSMVKQKNINNCSKAELSLCVGW